MDTKSKILDTAQALVETIGANAMSYQHISDAVGIRKASIHHHFPSKEHLLESLVARYETYFMGVVDRIVGSDKTGRAKLKEYIALFESTLREGKRDKACPMGMLGAEIQTIGEKPRQRVRHFYSENDRRLAAILEQGRKDGSLRFAGPAGALAGLVFGLLEGAMLVARGRGSVAHFRTVTGELLKLLEG